MFTLTRQPFDGPAATSKTLKQLLEAPGLKEMWQFSFVVDLQWLKQQRPDVVTHIVYGYYGQDTMQKVAGLKYHPVKLPNSWSCHHTKMMVLIFEDGCQVVVHTANMRPFDWSFLAQGMWVSPLLPKRANKLSRFRIDLTNYLCAYGLDSLRDLATQLREYDFAEIKDTFIGSVPSNSLNWGLDKITKTLPQTDLVVCQCSSIATLPQAYLDHMCSKFRTKRLEIVYPTVEQVASTVGGYTSGHCLFLQKNGRYASNFARVKPLLNEWKSKLALREMLAPHIKTYTGFVGNKVAWICWTSANMSQGAWGKPTKYKKSNLQNFEAGVLRVFEEPQPVAYLRDAKDWMMCYDWPLTKMQGEAWSQDAVYTQPDVHGELWPSKD